MDDLQPSLEAARRWFAEGLRTACHLTDAHVVDAFAAVPRETFAGPGPWRLFHFVDGYWSTLDADPRRLYHNVLVALDESRGLNIGEPALWARHFDRLDDRASAERRRHSRRPAGRYTQRAIRGQRTGHRSRSGESQRGERAARRPPAPAAHRGRRA